MRFITSMGIAKMVGSLLVLQEGPGSIPGVLKDLLHFTCLVYNCFTHTMFTLQTSFKPLLLKGPGGGGGGVLDFKIFV